MCFSPFCAHSYNFYNDIRNCTIMRSHGIENNIRILLDCIHYRIWAKYHEIQQYCNFLWKDVLNLRKKTKRREARFIECSLRVPSVWSRFLLFLNLFFLLYFPQTLFSVQMYSPNIPPKNSIWLVGRGTLPDKFFGQKVSAKMLSCTRPAFP